MKNVGIAIAAIIIILIVAVGGVFFLKYSKTSTMPKQITTPTSTQTSKTNSVTGTILGLIAGGKTVSCAIAYPDNKGTGTVFVADKKFAGDFNMKDAQGKETTAHIISDGTYIYIWSSAMPTGGIKMSLEAAKSAATNAQNNQSVNINQNVDMKCGQWTVDNSKFTVPATIKFTDMSKFFPQWQPTTVTPSTGTGAQTGTSPCDQVPAGPAKTACLNALQSSGQ
ncbi:MAG TPA: hypothetical protein VMR77_01705 [Patescibacteria group bacterium]|jgi:hypothetical protein|nr:hypothetical protein [Patescibacteria group bacterium]